MRSILCLSKLARASHATGGTLMTATLYKTATLDNEVPPEPFSAESTEVYWKLSTASEESLRTLGQALPNHPSLQASFHIDRPTFVHLQSPDPFGYASCYHINFLVVDVSIHDAQFKDLVQSWKAGTWHMSSIKDMVEHPAYQAIVRMGDPAVPLLLKELQTELDHWFIALSEITGADPVPLEDAGIVEKMREAWLSWGRKNNYI